MDRLRCNNYNGVLIECVIHAMDCRWDTSIGGRTLGLDILEGLLDAAAQHHLLQHLHTPIKIKKQVQVSISWRDDFSVPSAIDA